MGMRNYKRKSTRGSTSQEVFELAAEEVLVNNRKYRDVEKVKKHTLQDVSEEDTCFCLVCAESYNEDTSGLDWIQCILCKGWAHITCIRGDTRKYICHNCFSDYEKSNSD